MNRNDEDTLNGDVMPPDVQDQALAVDLERASIDMQIATAHKYPRSLDRFRKQVTTMACYNEAAAENCIYSLPRGGKPIIGPSIGFANLVATAWGNCIDGSRWVATDRKEKIVIAEGVFHDYETNRKTIITEQRRIVDSRGRLYSDDMIIVTSKAAGSIARRNAILQIVPRAIWHPIWEDALRIVRGDTTTFAEHKDRAIKSFSQFGVKPEQLFQYLGLRGEDDLTLEHIPILRGGYAALRDGSTTVEEMFDPRRMTGKGFETVGNPLADDDEDEFVDRAAPRQTAARAAPTPTEPDEPAPTAAIDDGDDDGMPFDIEEEGQQPAPAHPGPGPQGGASGAPRRRGRPRAPASASTPAPAAAAPSPAPAPSAALEPQQADVEPRTTAQYVDYWHVVMATAANATALDERWKSPHERQLRGKCGVIEDDLIQLRAEQDARLAQLRGAGG